MSDALLPRGALETGQRLLDVFPAVVIQGARRAGKSTLATELADGHDALTVTLDDRHQRDAAVADERAFVEQRPDGLMVIDEVQHLPELILAIKASIDRNRRPGRFLLTGSADLLSLKGRTDSLAGRAATLRLRGLSQGELAGQPEDFVSMILNGVRPHDVTSTYTRSEYVEVLARGGFPEVQDVETRTRNTWLDSYLDRILERDTGSLLSGRPSSRLRSVLTLIAANQSGELVKARIAKHASLAGNTVTAYLDVLRAVYLIEELRPWTANLTRREAARPKAFVADSALAMRLNRLTTKQLLPLTSDSIGGLFESLIVGELLKQQSWSLADYQLFHYRQHDGIEVDVIVELDDGQIIAIEAKASSSYRADQFKSLVRLRGMLGDRFTAGIVLGMAETGYQYADRLYGLPASSLWALG